MSVSGRENTVLQTRSFANIWCIWEILEILSMTITECEECVTNEAKVILESNETNLERS